MEAFGRPGVVIRTFLEYLKIKNRGILQSGSQKIVHKPRNPCRVKMIARDNRFQFFFTISCAQSAEPDESFLPCAFDGGVFPSLDLVSLLLQLLQKIFVVFGFFRQNVVDHAA